MYKKAFTEVARVTLETDTAGNQLQEASDVKVRGVIVGDVREVEASADGATIELAIKPGVPGADPGRRHRPPAAQDPVRGALRRPRAAREPLVRSGWPTATSSARTAARTPSSCSGSSTTPCRCCRRSSRRTSPTPSARSPRRCAAAATGLGAEPGGHRRVLRRDQHGAAASCRPTSPASPTSPTPTTARPTTCSPSSTTWPSPTRRSSTSRSSCAAPSPSARARRNELAGFLETNERNLISLAATSRPVLGLFAEYSPVYPCLLEGLTRSVPRIGETFGRTATRR